MIVARQKKDSVKKRTARKDRKFVQSRRRLAVGSPGALALEEARQAGLLDGESSTHVSFRAPPALIEAARREAGVTSATELGLMALALLAQPDPVAAFFKRTRGRLGKDHQLEY